MKRIHTTKTILAGAALAGIVSGGFLAPAKAASPGGLVKFAKTEAGIDAGVLADEKKGETHDCAGKNSCKGKGGCKSGDNGCAGKNSCKGKGGCAVKDGKPVHAQKGARKKSKSIFPGLRPSAAGAQLLISDLHAIDGPYAIQQPAFSMPANRFNAHTDYGIGIGLRIPHYGHILEKKPVVDWFEIISENYMVEAGRPLARARPDSRAIPRRPARRLDVFRQCRAPKSRPSEKAQALIKRTHTPWLSDHLCWGSVDGRSPTIFCPCRTRGRPSNGQRAISARCRIHRTCPSRWRMSAATRSFTPRR